MMLLPDKGFGQSDNQSIMFEEYWEVLSRGVLGLDYVIEGLAVTGGTDMTPAVSTGIAVSNGRMWQVTGADVTITTADTTNPRIDLIVVTSTGTLAVRAGTPAAAPKPPVRTANDVVIASVYVAANDTTIEQGCIDDKRVFFPAPEYEIKQNSTYTLTSTTAEQKLFGATTNGRLTLITGTYEFECQASISALSATAGNGAFDILGAGSAVLGVVLYDSTGVDAAAGTAANKTGSTMTAAQSPASQQTAGTATVWNFFNRGTFQVTTGGTIVPSVTLVTAAAGVVAAGSYFNCRRKAAAGAHTITGPWD